MRPRFTPLFFLGSLASAQLAHAANTPLEDVQKLASDWAQLRSENARLDSDWTTEQTLIRGYIQALESRIEGLEENRRVLEAATMRERTDQAQVILRNSEAVKALKKCDDQLRSLTADLIKLRPALPPRLSAALELPLASLARADLQTGERMQHIMTVINRCIQFNRTITYAEEAANLREEKDGRLLRVLYWGLAEAYALDTGTHKAYLGHPVAGQWQWDHIPEAAAVEQLLRIYNEKADPQFVPVPASIAASSPVATKTLETR